MPVSNPSAFPPPSSTDRIASINAGANSSIGPVFFAGRNAGNNAAGNISGLVVIGDNAGSAGLGTGSAGNYCDGIILIGQNAGAALTTGAGSTGVYGGSIIIGKNSYPLSNGGSGLLLFGHQILQSIDYTSVNSGNTDCIAIGNLIGTGLTSGGTPNCVLIGHGILSSGANAGLSYSVIIGSAACPVAATSSVGYFLSYNVIIGAQTCQNLSSGDVSANVVIGYRAAVTGTSGPSTNIVIGAGANVSGNNNVLIAATLPGYSPISITGNNQLLIGTNINGTKAYLIGGNFSLGNVSLGNTINYNNTDGSNEIFIPNGTKSATTPVGGGYFYISAGALHWVGSNGTDTTIASA